MLIMEVSIILLHKIWTLVFELWYFCGDVNVDFYYLRNKLFCKDFRDFLSEIIKLYGEVNINILLFSK